MTEKHLQQHYSDVIMSMMASQITSLTTVYTSVNSGTDQRKHQSSTSLAFVRGIHRWPVNSPHKGPVTQKMFPFHDVIIKKYKERVKDGLHDVYTTQIPYQLMRTVQTQRMHQYRMLGPSYLHNRISYIANMAFLYWIRVQSCLNKQIWSPSHEPISNSKSE